MNKSSNSRSSMFLMELIIAIMFFSLVSAICLRMFTASHLISRETKNLNMAVSQAGSVAEILKSTPDGLSLLQDLYPDAVLDTNRTMLYYDSSWESCNASNASFCLALTNKDPNTTLPMQSYTLIIEDITGTHIYTLDLNFHKPFYS